MPYDILFYSERVQRSIETLPKTLYARFLALADRMIEHGPHLGEPHTKAMKDGLFEMRLKGAEGIARVFYCAIIDRRIVIVHSFVKKTQKTPTNELATARKRLQEIKHEDV
ncbi:type II toxin-antitoxin system RelE/ParE family toxin [Ralstonia pickettii]|uniref:Type II toxin-antitoxin system RelE/ParE family toxin n=1 Tax=Ralstonia pickettii TaxID=329 RepID=A0A2N4TRT3_RALPI|nr:type II toxin-antitoxin system RelE/ParE family toxin [Ralstonia pickettii]PLC42418.1 type II toxin-antitoxin system RelE/ParE family toxin [Ralstonia pickettii]